MSYNLYNMIVYGYSLIKYKLPKNKVYLIKRMSATAAASNTPDASSSATSSGSNLVENHRYARTLEPRSKLTNPLTNVNVYVYKNNVNPLINIDAFKDHLFAVIIYKNKNKKPETKVFTQDGFKAFIQSHAVVPIGHSNVPIDDVATAVAIAEAIGDYPIRIAVGKYGKNYDGYRVVRMEDWMNPAFQAALLQAHKENGGWQLLERPLICEESLYVNEGCVIIDHNPIIEVGHNRKQKLLTKYSAMNAGTNVEWNIVMPTFDNEWRVIPHNMATISSKHIPCLFIEYAGSAEAPIKQVNPVSRVSREFKVGKYGTAYGDGWRRMTEVEWQTREIQAKLLEVQQEDGGWPLFEDPLQCNHLDNENEGWLHVTEGYVQIDGKAVVDTDHSIDNGLQDIETVYSAMNLDTREPWTIKEPALGNNWTVTLSKSNNESPCLFRQCNIAVGKYNETYDGWRQATDADWRNPTFQAQLVQAHQEGGGWALLKDSLVCNDLLFVAEGLVQIDGKHIIHVGFNEEHLPLHNVYSAMNYDTNVAWTTMAPVPSNNWTVIQRKGEDYPCLFVQDRTNPTATTSVATGSPVTAPVVNPDTSAPATYATAAATGSKNPVTDASRLIIPQSNIPMTETPPVLFFNINLPSTLWLTHYPNCSIKSPSLQLHVTNTTPIFLTPDMMEYCKQKYNGALTWENITVSASIAIYKNIESFTELNLYFHGFIFPEGAKNNETKIMKQFIFIYGPETLLNANSHTELQTGQISEIHCHRANEKPGEELKLSDKEIKNGLRADLERKAIKGVQITNADVDAAFVAYKASQQENPGLLFGSDKGGLITINNNTNGDMIVVCINDVDPNAPKICIVQLRILSNNDTTLVSSEFTNLSDILRANNFHDTILNMITTDPHFTAASTNLTLAAATTGGPVAGPNVAAPTAPEADAGPHPPLKNPQD